jgi:hypothetical protein
MAGDLEEFDALGPGDTLEAARRQVLESIADFIDVLGNQQFGAQPGLAVQLGIAHPGHIAVYALAESEQQAEIVSCVYAICAIAASAC